MEMMRKLKYLEYETFYTKEKKTFTTLAKSASLKSSLE